MPEPGDGVEPVTVQTIRSGPRGCSQGNAVDDAAPIGCVPGENDDQTDKLVRPGEVAVVMLSRRRDREIPADRAWLPGHGWWR
jgi:hypothetical protein